MRNSIKDALNEVKVNPEMKARVLKKIENENKKREHDTEYTYCVRVTKERNTARWRTVMAASILLGIGFMASGIVLMKSGEGTYGQDGTLSPTISGEYENLIGVYSDHDQEKIMARLWDKKSGSFSVKLIYLSETLAVIKGDAVIIVYDFIYEKPIFVMDLVYYKKLTGDTAGFSEVEVNKDGTEITIESRSVETPDISYDLETKKFEKVVSQDEKENGTEWGNDDDITLRYYIEREVFIPETYIESQKGVYYFAYGNSDFGSIQLIRYDLNKVDEEGKIECVVYSVTGEHMVENSMIYNPNTVDFSENWNIDAFSEKDIEEASELVKKYYQEEYPLIGVFERCEINKDTTIYESYKDTTKMKDILVYTVYLKGKEVPRNIILIRTKAGTWNVVNEGY